MSNVLRGEGAESLRSVCLQTVLDPNAVFGVVALGEPLAEHTEEIAVQLDLFGLAGALRQAWKQAGYCGRPSDFTFLKEANKPVGTHIDLQVGRALHGFERIVVLSMGRVGRARVYGKGCQRVYSPGQAGVNIAELQRARNRFSGMPAQQLPVKFVHNPNEILIIPTLPNPTAHAVDLIDPDRTTLLWDCTLAQGLTAEDTQ